VTYDGSESASGVQIYVDGSPETMTITDDALTASILNNVKLQISGREGSNYVFDGKIDEVRIWDTEFPDFEVTAEPDVAYNPTWNTHNISVQINPPLDGVTVNYVITDGPNAGVSGSGVTANGGYVDLPAYQGTDVGKDTILVWIDSNMNGVYDEDNDDWVTIEKYWFENFLTGGGNIKEVTTNPKGKSIEKVAYTFGGTVGYLEDGTRLGQFQITDHIAKESWHCHSDFSMLTFYGGPTWSPPASYDTAEFVGIFTSNKGGERLVHVTILDDQEPGSNYDHISVEYSEDGGANWTWWFDAYISGGNLQVHEGYKG